MCITLGTLEWWGHDINEKADNSIKKSAQGNLRARIFILPILSIHGPLPSIGVGVGVHLLGGEGRGVHLAPGVPDVEDDHRHEQRYP